MALTASIAYGNRSARMAGQPVDFIVTVTNPGSSAVSLTSLAANTTPGGGVTVAQPRYMVLNAPPGSDVPVLAAGASASYWFGVVFHVPYSPGPSPQNAPGDAAGHGSAFPANPNYTVTVTGLGSDGGVFSASMPVVVLTTIPPFPPSLGGALRLQPGFNLINYWTMLGA